MKINIKGTSISLTPAITEYAEKRMNALERFFVHDPTAYCTLELAKTSEHHKSGDIFKAEVHITAKDNDLYASAEEADLYKAIDMVRDEILREVRTSKSKKISLMRRGGLKVKNILKGLWPARKNNF